MQVNIIAFWDKASWHTIWCVYVHLIALFVGRQTGRNSIDCKCISACNSMWLNDPINACWIAENPFCSLFGGQHSLFYSTVNSAFIRFCRKSIDWFNVVQNCAKNANKRAYKIQFAANFESSFWYLVFIKQQNNGNCRIHQIGFPHICNDFYFICISWKVVSVRYQKWANNIILMEIFLLNHFICCWINVFCLHQNASFLLILSSGKMKHVKSSIRFLLTLNQILHIKNEMEKLLSDCWIVKSTITSIWMEKIRVESEYNINEWTSSPSNFKCCNYVFVFVPYPTHSKWSVQFSLSAIMKLFFILIIMLKWIMSNFSSKCHKQSKKLKITLQ